MFRNTTFTPPIGKMTTLPRCRHKAVIRKSNFAVCMDLIIKFEFLRLVAKCALHCGKYRGVRVVKVYSMLGDYKKYFFFAQTYLFLMGNIFGKINFFQKNFPKKILEIFFWKFLGNFFFFFPQKIFPLKNK